MPSSTLPAAFSIRQNLPSSASSIKYPMAPFPQNPLAAPSAVLIPHPSSVRHRLRAVLPETLRDAEIEPLSVDIPHNNNHNNTWHPPQPALQQVLTKGLPTESVFLLNFVALIWGSQHPVIKMVVNDCDPSTFSLVRFAFAALIASIFAPPWNFDGDENHTTSKAKVTWRWGAEMGFWMFLGYAFQAIGLEVSLSCCRVFRFCNSDSSNRHCIAP